MQEVKSIRVVVDTNIFISFLIGRKLKGLKIHLVNFQVKLVYTDQSIEELRFVTKRPALRKYFPPKDVEELLKLISGIGDLIEISEEPDVCRDPKDNYLLALSDKGNVVYLVTGDKDLLSLKRYKSTDIISYTEFETILTNI